MLLAAALGLVLGVITDRLGGQQLNPLSLPLWWVLGLQMAAYVVLLALACGAAASARRRHGA